jgi:hypothetical protein
MDAPRSVVTFPALFSRPPQRSRSILEAPHSTWVSVDREDGLSGQIHRRADSETVRKGEAGRKVAYLCRTHRDHRADPLPLEGWISPRHVSAHWKRLDSPGLWSWWIDETGRSILAATKSCQTSQSHEISLRPMMGERTRRHLSRVLLSRAPAGSAALRQDRPR